MNALIVGASSGLGRALAGELARRRYGLFLVSSDARDLDPLARDLALRFDVPVRFRAADLRQMDVAELRRAYLDAFAQLHALFIVAGVSDPDHDRGKEPVELIDDLIAVNFSAPVHIVNTFMEDLQSTPGANCVGIGSVAAARGRGANVVYGACKRGLEHYFEAVRHQLAGTTCRVQFYRVGYMRTAMLADRRVLLPAARPDWVARKIVSWLGRDQGMRYLPGWWRWLMASYRLIPWPVFRRLTA